MEAKDISHENVSPHEGMHFLNVPFCDWETGRGKESAPIFSTVIVLF